VLALGLVLHHLLAGTPALDEPDTARVIDRLPPVGRDIVRLPWTTPRPIAEPLRAIANRASGRDPVGAVNDTKGMIAASPALQK